MIRKASSLLCQSKNDERRLLFIIHIPVYKLVVLAVFLLFLMMVSSIIFLDALFLWIPVGYHHGKTLVAEKERNTKNKTKKEAAFILWCEIPWDCEITLYLTKILEFLT